MVHTTSAKAKCLKRLKRLLRSGWQRTVTLLAPTYTNIHTQSCLHLLRSFGYPLVRPLPSSGSKLAWFFMIECTPRRRILSSVNGAMCRRTHVTSSWSCITNNIFQKRFLRGTSMDLVSTRNGHHHLSEWTFHPTVSSVSCCVNSHNTKKN